MPMKDRTIIVGIDPSPYVSTGIAVAHFDSCFSRVATATDLGSGLCITNLLDLLGGVAPDMVLIERPTFTRRSASIRAATAWASKLVKEPLFQDVRFVCPVDWQKALLGTPTISNTVKERSMRLAEIFTGKMPPSDDVSDAVLLTEYGKKLMLGMRLKYTKCARGMSWPK